jgi:sulfoacetaldehyde dehydrogenase
MIVPYEGVGPDHPFSGEKLSAVMAFYKVADIHEAVALTNAIQEYQGMGHSCGIYSNSDDNIITLASGTKTSRVMVNQPQAASNSGICGMACAKPSLLVVVAGAAIPPMKTSTGSIW